MFKKFLLTCAAVILVIIAIEAALRLKYHDTAYVPGGTAARVQSYLKLHPKLGFTWKVNIDYDENIIIGWEDQVVEPLSTGPFGFKNGPRALRALKEGRPIDIIGLGDSQMQVASSDLHKFFWDRGLFYYNMGMHRHSPPQYNIVLDEHAIKYKPRWVVYGVFENDFDDTPDFENWKKSDLDWFTYHSGTWGGPPVSPSPTMRFIRKHLRGIYSYYRATRQMLKSRLLKAVKDSDRLMSAGVAVEKAKVSNIYNYVVQARDLASSNDIGFILLLIPSRGTMQSGSTFKALLTDALLEMLEGSGITIIDLRESYSKVSDTSTLYYKIDSHWNKNGATLAGEQIWNLIRETELPQEG